tara:strand:+ start:824 stop:1594 length:771 start_codon:yes stop_codon:yes gene_type:complete
VKSPDSLLLGELTSDSVSEVVENEDFDIILPLGACEQHGPHLPLSTDQIIAEAIAKEVAESVGNALVAPSIPVGVSGHHILFCGTATTGLEVYVPFLKDIVTSLLSHNFRSVYIITGHAGNSASMSSVVDHFESESVIAFSDWPAQRSIIHKVASEELGMDPEIVGTHAGHFETSIMLLLRPDLVNESRYERGFVGTPEKASSILMSAGMKSLSEIGVIGDPANSSKVAGRLYLNALVGHVTQGIEAHRNRRVSQV